MNILVQLILRSVLVVALNDGIILYIIKKRKAPITWPIIIGTILVTCIALVINIWFCLKNNGLI